jgi:hypothetical protein
VYTSFFSFEVRVKDVLGWYTQPRHNSLNQVVQKVFVWTPKESHIWESNGDESIPDDSHYFCALVPELFSLVYKMPSSALTASEALAAGLGSVAVPAGGVSTTAAGLTAAGRPGTRCQTVLATARSQANGARNTDGLAPEVPEEDEELGFELQDLFRNPREQVSIWKDADLISGSTAATYLVTEQVANRLALCAKAILATPDVLVGLVFITVATGEDVNYNVVW